MTRLVTVSRDQLLAEREEVLRRYGLTLDEFAERARTYTVVGSEWEAWSQLQDIDFLLGDDHS